LKSTATFGRGNWLAVMLSDSGLATMAGEPPGNAPSSYGDILRIQMPASRYMFTVSHKQWSGPDPVCDPVVTLLPDIEIPATWQKASGRRDVQLEMCLSYLVFPEESDSIPPKHRAKRARFRIGMVTRVS
jgi:hypothetical protein